jgi:hypothetical protein
VEGGGGVSNSVPVRDTTRGFAQDVALRKRYKKERFGLETVFVRREWAESRVAEIKTVYDLDEADIRLVKHISSPETGEKIAWEIYVKAGKRLQVVFL